MLVVVYDPAVGEGDNVMADKKNDKAQQFAGVGGLIGLAIVGVTTIRQLDLSSTEGMQQAVGAGFVGLMIGAVVGYLIGKSVKS